MGESRMILITVILLIAALITSLSLFIYTTEAGLHYLIIIYDSISLFILGGISYFITNKIPVLKITPVALMVISLVTFIFTVNLGSIAMMLGLVSSSFGVILIMVLVYLVWYNQARNRIANIMKNYLG
ncbi:hypothetical protein [Pontibacter mangrovi]|uniref:Uncharacterized protein n=1 Tax=Pontibacter mangrovi TaxID=2589816 RepID=A0A501WAT7_9BACT|nr:hypothetical protein [Pontibacter mangrovi]TPE42686.1 hypothetical protein FJM65_16620 [Pontibacter mangrovi]